MLGKQGSIMQGAYDRLRADMQNRAGESIYGNDLPGSVVGKQFTKPVGEQLYGNDLAKSQPLSHLKSRIMALKNSGAQLDPSMASEIYDTLAPLLRRGGGVR